jgi:hypothetical protein
MIGEDLGQQLDGPCSGHVRQTDQAGVGLSAAVDQRPEISVHRYRNAPFVGGQAEQRRIAGIATQCSGLENIVSLAAQPLRQPATGTAVNRQPQTDVTRTASRLSSASAACA